MGKASWRTLMSLDEGNEIVFPSLTSLKEKNNIFYFKIHPGSPSCHQRRIIES